ncbi:hypothetical protein AB0H36_43840 [Kribbella sp. NPDC050820]|uniref:hypothetical protein n=1 Tax=Kribbella sp. NPDC050820 TaxID=3155408 RepID=UPI003409BD5F
MVNERLLKWEQLDKHQATELQAFTCTDEWPRTAKGRRLPKHPREWEWAAQRHFRTLAQRLQAGETLLVGRDDENAVGAAVHLSYEQHGVLLVATFEAGAVSTHFRNMRDRYVGDEIMAVGRAEAGIKAVDSGASTLVLQGCIHEQNRASMRMAARADWEPEGLPTPNGYQLWATAFDPIRE